ncbi:DUF3969 family protein [Saccharibacillus sp. JS10]|uniref:DUF3969 family protein n=1 Tax=Saccharibacillus sp. JS10 TaxID=2950552 RepID=UPI00210A9580|nr:DUF3969 family protein [Saccharibacillus sp. JS10]MCQ4087555.1 DUF3969 family protein [Saccharibacillus sp. JS10]
MKSTNENQKLVSIIQLGFLTALEKEVITIEEAEAYLFSPFTSEKLKAYGFSESVINIILEGCELEDVESLLPNRLQANIVRIKEEILKNITSFSTVKENIEKVIK